MAIQPSDISDRFTVTLPDIKDRLILIAIMETHGIRKSSAIRVALRAWAREHGILPETLSIMDTSGNQWKNNTQSE